MVTVLLGTSPAQQDLGHLQLGSAVSLSDTFTVLHNVTHRDYLSQTNCFLLSMGDRGVNMKEVPGEAECEFVLCICNDLYAP